MQSPIPALQLGVHTKQAETSQLPGKSGRLIMLWRPAVRPSHAPWGGAVGVGV